MTGNINFMAVICFLNDMKSSSNQIADLSRKYQGNITYRAI